MARRQRALCPSPSFCLIVVEALQWCANSAVYYLGLISGATYDLSGSAFLIAAVTLARNLSMGLGNMLSGPLIDFMGPRIILVVTLAVSIAAGLFTCVMDLDIYVLFFAAVFLGLSSGFLNTITHALPRYLENDESILKDLNARLVFYGNITFTLGPVIGGLIVDSLGTRAVFLFLALCEAVALPFAFGCVTRFKPDNDSVETNGLLSYIVEGARSTFSNNTLRIVFMSGFLGFFAFGAFDSLESLFYRDVLLVGPLWMGWLSAMTGLTSTIGSWLLTKIPANRADFRFLLASLILIGFGLMVYVGTPWLVVALIGQAITGFGWGFLEPLQLIIVQAHSSLSDLGRVTGFIRFGLMSAGVIPLMFAPAISALIGVQATLLLAASIIFGVGIVFYMRYGRGA